MLHTTQGRGKDCYVYDDTTNKKVENLLVNSGDVITITDDMHDHLGISYTYKSADNPRTVIGSASDSVNHTTKVWTIVGANGAAADVGGTLVVTGTSTSNGTYTISAASGNSITTGTGPGSDETFTSSAHFVITPPSLAATIAWFVNNNRQDGTFAGQFNLDGLWIDATGDLTPTPSGITGPTSDWIQADELMVGWSRLTFTATAGQGLLSVYRVKKGSI